MTSSERFVRLRELFDAAVALPPEARLAFAEKSTPDDDELRAELVGLLKVHEHTSFLSSPVEAPASVIAQVREQQRQSASTTAKAQTAQVKPAIPVSKLAIAILVPLLFAVALGTGFVVHSQIATAKVERRVALDHSRAERARRNFASIEYRLPPGKVDTAGVKNTIARIESYLSQADAAVSRNSLTEATALAERAESELDRLSEAIGK
jgi:hypothetical protein